MTERGNDRQRISRRAALTGTALALARRQPRRWSSRRRRSRRLARRSRSIRVCRRATITARSATTSNPRPSRRSSETSPGPKKGCEPPRPQRVTTARFRPSGSEPLIFLVAGDVPSRALSASLPLHRDRRMPGIRPSATSAIANASIDRPRLTARSLFPIACAPRFVRSWVKSTRSTRRSQRSTGSWRRRARPTRPPSA